MNDNKKLYEIGYLLVPQVAEEKIPEEVAVLKSAIETGGGNIVAEGEPKLRKLAYEVVKRVAGSGRNSKYEDAYFGWMKFETTGKGARDINIAVKKLNNIMRFIIIKTVIEEKPIRFGAPRREERGEKVKISDKEIDEKIDVLLSENSTA